MSNQEQVAAMAGAMSVLQLSLGSSLPSISAADPLSNPSGTRLSPLHQQQQYLSSPPQLAQPSGPPKSKSNDKRPHSAIVGKAGNLITSPDMNADQLSLRSGSPTILSPKPQQLAARETRPVSQHSTPAKSPLRAPSAAGRSQLSLPEDEEEQIRRLKEMFPAAPEQVIGNMIHIYHDLEGLIKAALIALGYRCSPEYTSQQASSQNHIMLMMSKPSSKKLYEKLSGYFPEKDEALIKRLMFEHKEVEHEVISALVESGLEDSVKMFERSAAGGGGTHDKTGVIMKLRYLKHLFPSCEEIELYHLLHCTNLNAQRVIEQVESRGHKPANIDEIMQTRKSRAQQMRAQATSLMSKQQAPTVDLLDAHLKRVKPVLSDTRIATLTETLRRKFPQVEGQLLVEALKAADYSESLAAKFLEEMAPIDEQHYKQRSTFYRQLEPTTVLFPCKGVQKGHTSFMSITSNEYVAIERQVLDCTTALALPKVDACTFTRDDFDAPRKTQARGRRGDLAVGSMMQKQFDSAKTRDSPRQGAKIDVRKGSQYAQVCTDSKRLKPNSRAQRRNTSFPRGPNASLRCGPNSELLERVHPFLLEE